MIELKIGIFQNCAREFQTVYRQCCAGNITCRAPTPTENPAEVDERDVRPCRDVCAIPVVLPSHPCASTPPMPAEHQRLDATHRRLRATACSTMREPSADTVAARGENTEFLLGRTLRNELIFLGFSQNKRFFNLNSGRESVLHRSSIFSNRNNTITHTYVIRGGLGHNYEMRERTTLDD